MFNTSTFAKVAIAATLATTIIATSMTDAQAGKRERNIFLGVAAGIVGAAIVHDRYKKRRYARDCWYERVEKWSPRRGRYVIRTIKVCD